MITQTEVQVLVTGRVQGVGFRHFTKVKAELHHIRGFVQNLADGRVEVVGVGTRSALEALIEDLHIGPPASQVQKCLSKWQVIPDFFPNFSIRL